MLSRFFELSFFGLLNSTAGGIAAAGAGAMAGATGLVAAAGAAGYGIGTLINKGIDAGVSKFTGGAANSIGEAFWNLTHRKEIAEQKELEKATKEKMALVKVRWDKEKQLHEANLAELRAASGWKPPAPDFADTMLNTMMNSSLAGTSALLSEKLKNIKLSPEELRKLKGMSKEDAIKFLKEVKGLGDVSVNDVIEKIKTLDISTITDKISLQAILSTGIAGATLATGIATELVNKASSLEVGKTLTAIYDKSEGARIALMEKLSDGVDELARLQGSQTVQAIGESLTDIKNVATGGSVTNMFVPIAAHDKDYTTNLLASSNNS